MSAPEAWVPCQTCMATGGVRVPCLRCKNGEPEHSHTCPDCSDGLVPSDGEIEAAAEALTEKRPGIIGEIEMAAALHFAKRALVAARRYQSERKS